MPNKIVQLIDNEDNNIYPVAGSLAQGSVTTSTINDGAVTAAKIDFTTMPGNYSASEIDTGYTWVDGKHIYKKTVNFGALPNNTTKAVAHNISNLDQVIRIDGIVNAGSSWQPLGYYDGGAIRVAYAGNTNVNIYTTSNQSGSSAYITLYYTKSS